MTLNLTVVNQWGVWQCSDLRLTVWPSGKVVDDYSIKHVSIRATDGAALITYTGLGKVGGRSVADWLRRTIRGKSLTVDETLLLIKKRANSKLAHQAASLGISHTFMVGAFLANRPWVAAISNADPADPDVNPPQPKFSTEAIMIGDQQPPLAVVTGAREAVSPEDGALLGKIAERKPKRPIDYRNLLAEINRRASKQRPYGKLISEACFTAYIPPTGEPFQQETHWWGLARSSVERTIPTTLFGIDITEIQRAVIENSAGLHDPDPAKREEAQKRFHRLSEQAARRAVEPGI